MKFINKWCQKLKCFFGLHKWEYNEEHNKRRCKCGVAQEYWCNLYWCECIDGEPIL